MDRLLDTNRDSQEYQMYPSVKECQILNTNANRSICSSGDSLDCCLLIRKEDSNIVIYTV